VSGTVNLEGAPQAGVQIYGNDDLLDTAVAQEVCTEAGGCSYVAITDAQGHFEFNLPWMTLLTLSASHGSSVGEASVMYGATRTLSHCPTKPVVLNLDVDLCTVPLPILDYEAATKQISWDPPARMEYLSVSGMTSVKWAFLSLTGFEPPVTYGQVPTGAEQILPLDGGSPDPIQSGDILVLHPLGGFMEYQGMACYSNQYLVVP
jgi:hypothetical protein